MKKVAIFGACSPIGFGDALQYYNLLNSLSNKLSDTNLIFLCPDLKKQLIIFRGLKMKHFWMNINYNPLYMILQYKNMYIKKEDVKFYFHVNESDTHAHIYNEKTKKSYIDMLLKVLRLKLDTFMNDEFAESILSFTSLTTYKLIPGFNFDAGFVGGHTLAGGGLTGYTQFYRSIGLMVKGPIILAPISMSLIGVKHDIGLFKFLKRSVKKFNRIYVRGPYTFKLIKMFFNIDENRISMCLDSGFWHLLDPTLSQLVRNSHVKKERVRILLFPRMDYFYAYNKNILYKYYLHCLKDLILRLSKKYDCEFIIASYTVDNSSFSASKAVEDLIDALKNNIEKLDLMDLVYVEKPRTLIDNLRLCSSADIVLTSFMHAGIVALSAGTPTVFILPRLDIKVLDVIRYLNLSVNKFFIDMFDPVSLRSDNVLNLLENIIKNLEYYKSVVTRAINKALPDAQYFIDDAVKLVMEY